MHKEASGGSRAARLRVVRTAGEKMRSWWKHLDPLELGPGTECLVIDANVGTGCISQERDMRSHGHGSKLLCYSKLLEYRSVCIRFSRLGTMGG